MIEKLKGIVVARYTIEELMELAAVAGGIMEQYLARKLAVPQWLLDSQRELSREIDSRVRDERMRRVSELKSKMDRFVPPEERRAAMAAEIASLEESLK